MPVKFSVRIELAKVPYRNLGYLSNKISTSFPLIQESKNKFHLDRKKKLLSNDIMKFSALLLNTNDHLITHKRF